MKKLFTIFALLGLCSANASTCLESNTLNGMTLSIPAAEELVTAIQAQTADSPHSKYGNYGHGIYSRTPSYFQIVVNKIDNYTSRVQVNYAVQSAMSYYSAHYPALAGLNVSVLEAVSLPINNSKGVELRNYGTAFGNDSRGLLQIAIPDLSEKSNAPAFTMHFKGKVVASGSLNNCQQDSTPK